MEEVKNIGDIGNYYGGLNIKEEDGKFFGQLKIMMEIAGKKYRNLYLTN
jgi:hypothetical protein